MGVLLGRSFQNPNSHSRTVDFRKLLKVVHVVLGQSREQVQSFTNNDAFKLLDELVGLQCLPRNV